jgi:hypothetical protein
MALLKEDNSFTHVIAIDFGTGASGYFLTYLDMLLHPEIQIKTAKSEYKSSVHVMAAMTKKPQPRYCSIMTAILLTLEQMRCKNMHKSLKMAIVLYFSKM